MTRLKNAAVAAGMTLAIVAAIATTASADPPGELRSTDGAGVDTPIEIDDALDQHGDVGGHLPASSENVELVGKLDTLTNVTGGIADVGAFGKFAYLNAFGPECAGRPGAQGTGVHVVSIADPTNPTKVGFLPAHANSLVNAG